MLPMVLSGKAIKKAVSEGLVVITPFDESHIEAAHVNLHLEDLAQTGGTVILAPKGFTVVRTKESIKLSESICGIIEGRSKLAQQGVSVEQSSTLIEPGTNSTMALEIFNASDRPVTLEAGQKIAKMILFTVTDEI